MSTAPPFPPGDFAWALIGPGRIAHRFAAAVSALPGMHLRSVHGRDPAHAAAFARHWTPSGSGEPRVEPDLAALLADPRVDAAYVATPHALHASAVRACLTAGKPVLCEKPLVPNAAQARELVALSRQRGVFLMEALWTRLLPVYTSVRRWLDVGAIGPVRALQSSFGFAAPYDPTDRLFDPAMGGGSLLDIGVYCLAMTRWVLEPRPGACPEPSALLAHGRLAPTGVDRHVAATLSFGDGAVSQFVCTFDAAADNALRIYGERGSIAVEAPFWEATEARLVRPGQPAETLRAPLRVNGFEYQIEEVVRCVRAGLVESGHVPHAESMALASWMDRLRAEIGVRYPFE